MMGLKLEETRIYRDLERQAKEKVIPKLTAKGMSIEEIAEIVELSIEEVRSFLTTATSETEISP